MLPFFVYGTLLPGHPNDHYWQDGVVRSVPAVLPGAQLYAFPNFPMMIESSTAESEVMGALIWVKPEVYSSVLANIDLLENYDPANVAQSPYLRVEREAVTADGDSHLAWTYLGKPELIARLPCILHGDWERHTAENNDLDLKQKWWLNRSSDKLF